MVVSVHQKHNQPRSPLCRVLALLLYGVAALSSLSPLGISFYLGKKSDTYRIENYHTGGSGIEKNMF